MYTVVRFVWFNRNKNVFTVFFLTAVRKVYKNTISIWTHIVVIWRRIFNLSNVDKIKFSFKNEFLGCKSTARGRAHLCKYLTGRHTTYRPWKHVFANRDSLALPVSSKTWRSQLLFFFFFALICFIIIYCCWSARVRARAVTGVRGCDATARRRCRCRWPRANGENGLPRPRPP